MTVPVAAWQITDTTGNHNKFYRAYVALDGNRAAFSYGRIGTVQELLVSDFPTPFAARAAALRKLEAKLNDARKGYQPDGDTYLLDVPEEVWDDRYARYGFDDVYQQARYSDRRPTATLLDGTAHIVAHIGGARSAILPGFASAAERRDGACRTRVAVLSAADCAAASAAADSPLALVDLGVAEDTDSTDTLDVALRLWTPGATGPQSRIAVCLDNARMILTPMS